MTRYFFDVNAKAFTEYDYKGQYLLGLEQAQQMAELVAMDLGCTRIDGSFTVDVQVRDAAGRQLLSVPVPMIDAIAA